VRWDSPVVLATAGTLAIHVLFAVLGDALVVVFPAAKHTPAPRVELVDIEPLPEPPPPPPQPVVEQEPAAEIAPEVPAPPPPREARPQRVRTSQPPAQTASEAAPPSTTPSSDSGGAPVTTMEDIAPAATGVAVAKGPRTTGKVGRGGSGGGTGAGTGAGNSDAPPAPMSVATIKTPARPKGDFSYFDASKDYPAEAKTLAIEGVIRVRLIVDAEGKVTSAVLLDKLGHGLDELALERTKKIQFEPAKDTDDKAVSSVVVWTFNMTLPK
jgi:periplasmic protein TonB